MPYSTENGWQQRLRLGPERKKNKQKAKGFIFFRIYNGWQESLCAPSEPGVILALLTFWAMHKRPSKRWYWTWISNRTWHDGTCLRPWHERRHTPWQTFWCFTLSLIFDLLVGTRLVFNVFRIEQLSFPCWGLGKIERANWSHRQWSQLALSWYSVGTRLVHQGIDPKNLAAPKHVIPKLVRAERWDSKICQGQNISSQNWSAPKDVIPKLVRTEKCYSQNWSALINCQIRLLSGSSPHYGPVFFIAR